MTGFIGSSENLANVTDGQAVGIDFANALNGARDVEFVTRNGETFIYVAAQDESAIQILQFDPDAGSVSVVGEVRDTAGNELFGVTELEEFVIGNNTLLFAVGRFDDGITTYRVQNNGNLVDVTSLIDADTSSDLDLALDGARDFEILDTGSEVWAFVTAENDDAINVLTLNNNGSLSVEDVVIDSESASFELDGAAYVTTWEQNDNVFIGVTGVNDDGLSVFRLNQNNGNLVNTDNISDGSDDATLLNGASGIASASINGTNYIYVASQFDDSITVFEARNNGTLDFVNEQNLFDSGEFDQPASIEVFEIEGVEFLQVSTFTGDSSFIYALNADGSISELEFIDDAGLLELDGAAKADFTEIDGRHYYSVAGAFDDGISIFEIGGGDDLIGGTSEADVLLGLNGNDDLFGGGGADLMLGGDGSDVLSGRGGGDVLDGGNGGDVMIGGGGNDTATYENSASGVTIDLSAGTASGGEASGDILIQIESVTGTESADTLTGDTGNNTLTGLGGSDALSGQNGDDTIRGGGGGDNISGGGGDDRLFGESGGDDISGGSGSDSLSGGGGSDTLNGGNQDDTLTGGGGGDTLNGGNGDDEMRGGGGSDELIGGGGDNIYTGDGGNDDFVFAGNSGTQTVTDFTQGSDDLDVSAFASSRAEFNEIILIGDTILQLIADPTVTIVLEGFDAGLTNGDFIF